MKEFQRYKIMFEEDLMKLFNSSIMELIEKAYNTGWEDGNWDGKHNPYEDPE